MSDDMEDPDNVNAYLDQAGEWTEDQVANVVPFKAKGESRTALNPEMPVITLEAGELHNIATQAETALIGSETPFYVRAGGLMRPVVDEMPAANNRRTKVARLSPVSEPAMIDRLSRSAVWLKWDGRVKKYLPADPTSKIAATVLSRDGEWRFPRLSGVITTPTMRPDGTILSKPGYDEATQLLLLDPPEMPAIAPRPSKAQALSALNFLDALLDEFPFVDAGSRSVALSALITPVVRGAIQVAPMHVTTAPVAGSGKSYIIDLASAINSGERAPVVSAGKTEEEMEKRLVGALLSGQTFISLDNVNGDLGGDFLCQMIERPVVMVRPLGQSAPVKIESRASCYATGNNIRPTGDMTRRVLLCSLDPDMERPELRTFKANPFDEVLAHRGKYIAAALTIVRAYVVAGCPDQRPKLASFEDWSKFVRSAIVWLGRTDPVETMNKVRGNDPAATALLYLFNSWHGAVLDEPKTAGEIAKVAMQRGFNDFDLHHDLKEALIQVAEDKRGGISPVRLGNYLTERSGKVSADMKLVEAGAARSGAKLWKIVKIDSA